MLLNYLKVKKNLLFLAVVFLLVIPISYAQTCEVPRTKDVLRENLFLHFTNPASSPLSVSEVRDLLNFYLNIPPGATTADCSAPGPISSTIISVIVDDGETAADVIPTCSSDGTKYGQCSGTKPGYCYGGSIINRCGSCGCPSQTSCDTINGNCVPASGIACFTDLDCGTDQFTGSHY